MSDQNLVNRRDFVKTAGSAVAATSLLGADAFAQAPTGLMRYAIIGTGDRATGMWGRQIRERYSDVVQFVGLCDSNPKRVEISKAMMGVDCPTFTNFDEMLEKTKPNVVMVTTKDAFHSQYIVRALDRGLDVMTEKPMVIDEKQCQAVLDAEKRNKKKIIVTFNYRFAPKHRTVKEILMSGEIGKVLSVDFAWYLDVYHGADYFRRWHAYKNGGGSLWVHKATHHFDLVNWWLGSEPELVQAYGKKEFYTPKMAKRMGLDSHHERCKTCPEKAKCTFYLDIDADKNFKMLYSDNEKHDGYFRDRCVWRPDIDIEDTMNVIVKYRTGATLSYSLNAFNAWEGYTIAFNGTKGRIEHRIVEGGQVSAGSASYQGEDNDAISTYLIPLRGKPQKQEVWTGTGGHGGGDTVMLTELFGTPADDKYKRAADERSGFYSILIGAAANQCFTTGNAVKIADLVNGLTSPVFAPMPTRDSPVPMPPGKV
jgi:predicted dehydrogenase